MTVTDTARRPARDGPSAPVQVRAEDRLTGRDARLLAGLTRAAYRGRGYARGLPAPDGAHDRTRDLLAAAQAGVVWTARVGGQPVGAVRVVAEPGGWRLYRLAVPPRWRGLGIGRSLLDAVAAAAHAESVPELRLDAVVERALPQYYAALGFRVRHRFGATDKPLTEVRMVRPAAGPGAAVDWPWAGDAALCRADPINATDPSDPVVQTYEAVPAVPADPSDPTDSSDPTDPSDPTGSTADREGYTVTWWHHGGRLVARACSAGPYDAIAAAYAELGRGARFAGADRWGAADGATLYRLVQARRTGGYPPHRPPRAYLTPRRLCGGVRALCRFPGGIAVPDALARPKEAT